MKRNTVYLLLAIVAFYFGNNIEAISSNRLELPPASEAQLSAPLNPGESLPDDEFFHIDDSLLLSVFPSVHVKPQNAVQQNVEFSHSLKLHYTANDVEKPIFLILTTPSLYNELSREIARYAEDVHAIYGYGIYLETVMNATAEQLKSLIVSYQDNLCGVFVIGDFPACMFEISNDYDKYGYRKWICDLYYMDLDGSWLDVDNNGVYDSHTGHVAPDIYFARLSAAGMLSMDDEVTLIRKQLQKSHRYWWESSFNTQDTALGYINKDWVDMLSLSHLRQVFSSASADLVQFGRDSCFSKNDYLSRLTLSTYGFTYLAAHSAPTLHQFSDGYVYVPQIHGLPATSSFAYNLFCCSACNWSASNYQGYLGGAYLFHDGTTMTVLGSTKTGSMPMSSARWFYQELPTHNIGDSYKLWWRNGFGDSYHSAYTVSWTYGMTILGDPTINFRHRVGDYCTDRLELSQFPPSNISNLVLYRASKSIHVTEDFHIPQGVHVVFDAPEVIFAPGFKLVKGATIETRGEGCEL